MLQERRFKRIGGTKDIEVDVRILAATNEDLRKAVAEGRFREDLLHRIQEFTIHLLPLRERREDIPRFAQHFVSLANERLGEVRRGQALLTAGVGQQIHLTRRQHHAMQDWLRWPVTGIDRSDASAYLEWLARTGKVPGARFCSESEWERAARGADARGFPTGDDIDVGEANYDERYARDPEANGPDEVGTNVTIVSPFGLHDTAGNVWEWVRADGEVDANYARWGSFFHSKVSARTINRPPIDPTFADGTLGLRVCASLQARGGVR